MTRFYSARSKVATRCATAGLCAALTIGLAQQGLTQTTENVRGKVREFTTAPRGEMDGAILENGTILHWPPHLEDRFRNAAAVGEQVEAVGMTETGPQGDTHFEVTRLTNSRSGAVADNDRAGPPPRGRRGRNRALPATANSQTITGVVRSLTTAPRGEIDGALLDDGTVLHWPPHLESIFQAVATVGARVKAIGVTETAPRGETHFEVQSVTNQGTGAVATNDDFGGPGSRGRGPRRPLAKRAPGASTVQGVVRSVTTAPRGEVDGAILDNGTTLHWPPHLQDEFANLAVVGERVTATGQTETAPRGEVQFEVDSLKNDRTGATSGETPTVASAEPVDRQARLRALEQQLLDIQREIEQLKRPQ